MNVRTTQNEHLNRISELITLRDNLQNSERQLAGLANKRGFELDSLSIKEGDLRNSLSRTRKLASIKAYFNRIGLLCKGLRAVLEKTHILDTRDPKTKKLIEAIEELLCYGWAVRMLVKLLLTPTSIGFLLLGADFVAEFVLHSKIFLKLRKLSELKNNEAKLDQAMEYFWDASEDFKRFCPVVVEELNREIDRWQS